MRSKWWDVLLIALLVVILPGCTTEDTFGLQLDLTHLNWQTGALIALAYLANSKGHFAALANMLRGLLQQLKILPAVTTPEALTAEKLALLLADLFTQLQGQPELQAKVLEMMTVSSAKAVANASASK